MFIRENRQESHVFVGDAETTINLFDVMHTFQPWPPAPQGFYTLQKVTKRNLLLNTYVRPSVLDEPHCPRSSLHGLQDRTSDPSHSISQFNTRLCSGFSIANCSDSKFPYERSRVPTLWGRPGAVGV